MPSAKNKGSKVTDTFRLLIEWLWVPLYAAAVQLFRMAFSNKERLSVVERDAERSAELHESLKDHNAAVLQAIGGVQAQTNSNAERLTSIEKHLMSRGDG